MPPVFPRELRPTPRWFWPVVVAVYLLLLALPLAAQSPVGTWEAETVRVVQGTEVTDHGTITFRADGTYTAARKWTWTEDGLRSGLFSYAEGTWRIDKVPSDDGLLRLCVKRDDVASETCQPFTATAHTLQWGPFTFTGSAE